MMDFFIHITSGNPRALVRPTLWCVAESLNKILLGILGLLGLQHLFRAHMAAVPPDFAYLAALCAGMVVLSAVLYFVCAKSYWETFGSAYSASAEGRIALAEKLRKLPLGSIMERETSDLANMFMADYEMMEMVVSHMLPQMLGAMLMPALAFLCLLFVDWRMSVAMFACVPLSLAVLYIACRVTAALGSRHVAARIEAGGRLQEYLDGMLTLKSYNLAGDRFIRLEQALRRLAREAIVLEGGAGAVVSCAICLMRGGLSVMILAGAYWCANGSLDIAAFIMFLLVGSAVLEPATNAFMQLGVIRYAALSAERIHAVIAAPIMPGTEAAPAAGEATMRDVTFAYDKDPVLREVSAAFPQGRLLALVGPSGGGKSTILRLLARFFDPQKGTVALGGKDLRGLDPESVLLRMSQVFQDTYLFRGTIAMNIRIGDPSATDAQVENAARRACCHDFVAALPDKYETMVGEGGSTLSGGEKQRISIARSLLKNAPIVLLDEATASLDPENEAYVQHAINALVKDRTVVVIAHKLKTVQNADCIFVIDAGRIVEQGTHGELLTAKGVYERMWNLQRQGGGWRIEGSNPAIPS